MFKGIFEPGEGRVLGIYLRILAVLYALGAVVHLGNLLGFGEVPGEVAPRLWVVLDGVYLLLDAVVAVGLWRRRWWGVALFLVAALSQLVLFLGFGSSLAHTPEQRELLDQLVGLHLLTVLVYVVLRGVESLGRVAHSD